MFERDCFCCPMTGHRDSVMFRPSDSKLNVLELSQCILWTNEGFSVMKLAAHEIKKSLADLSNDGTVFAARDEVISPWV
jgi:hypothetical protein